MNATRAATDKGFIAAPRAMISDHALPWLFPLVAMLVVFALFPFFYNVWLSFHEFVPRERALEWVGTDNWAKLFSDGRMWGALGITLLYNRRLPPRAARARFSASPSCSIRTTRASGSCAAC